jgi:glutamate-ammonia-ligase adenylyltransferase
MVDIEFIAQVLQLIHARNPKFHRSQTTHIALRRLSVAGALSKADAKVLIQAERLWRTVQGMLRMTVGRIEATTLPAASATLLLRAAADAGVPAVDTDDFLRKAENIALEVRLLFERYVGKLG